MTIEIILGVFIFLVAAVLSSVLAHKKVPRKLKTDRIQLQWKELQSLCRNKETWPEAIVEADKLLDAALKRRRFQGKSMGERIVAAQRTLTNNDGVWFAHNLSKKIVADSQIKLKEADVKEALMGFRQALRDLGALPTNKEAQPNDK